MDAERRGQRTALIGLVLQLALVALATALWWFTGSGAAWPAVWLTVAPVPMWALTVVLFYCRFLQRREQQELEELAARGGEQASIFVQEQGQPEMRPAAERVRWMERYLVPLFTLLLAGYHLALGIVLWRGAVAHELGVGAPPAVSIFFAVGGAFVAFLFSRYATGMARVDSWRLLRAPGSYLFTNSLIYLLLAGALTAQYFKAPGPGLAVFYMLAGFMILLGAELVLNFVLDLYRPRLPEAETRYSYDSRLLNLIASPESIGHSIAEALNYQFGFEVSSTWFYKLLQRALVPLLLVGALIVWLMTSVIVVREGEEYVVLHWGRPLPRTLKPRACPYLIWPWPIDTARKFQTGKLHEIVLGAGEVRKEAQRLKFAKRVYLWTEEHGLRKELDTLVAARPSGAERRHGRLPSVAIIKLVVPVYYRIADPYKFGYKFTDAHRLLEGLAQREMVRYAATATVDGIMSANRWEAVQKLRKAIERAAREYDLGVEIAHVELLACHPPKDAAPAFEAVLAAEREQDKLRYRAQAEANRMLAEVAGDPDDALRLAQLIRFHQDLGRLLNLRNSRRDIRPALLEAIRRTRGEMQELDKEIHIERLLGRLRPGRQTAAQELRQREQAHLELLGKILRELRDFPLAVHADRLRDRIDTMLGQIQGQAAVLIAQASADRWRDELDVRARAESFQAELTALRSAPTVYPLDRYLSVLTEAMKGRRKYVLGVDRDRVEVWLNLEEPVQTLEDISFKPEKK